MEVKQKDLDEYDHLRRILRLCCVHFLCNIRQCAVSDEVRTKMRSLVCIEHASWDETLRAIEEEGGKAGKDWLADKVRCKFAFPGICWAKSFIPRLIWQVGDSTSNIIESLHSDVNSEGVSCTLVGGLKKGQRFDILQQRTLQVWKDTGVRPGYKQNDVTASTTRSLKRKATVHHQSLQREDRVIEQRNKRLKLASEAKEIAMANLVSLQNEHEGSNAARRAEKGIEKAYLTYTKAVSESLQSIWSGSGKVALLLPSAGQGRGSI
ncbi:hypothetical protein DXG01_003763 [Tephrocybe rancida]|nr:hypothetical protein DXG01_003763 [Tephrocybe rancida]